MTVSNPRHVLGFLESLSREQQVRVLACLTAEERQLVAIEARANGASTSQERDAARSSFGDLVAARRYGMKARSGPRARCTKTCPLAFLEDSTRSGMDLLHLEVLSKLAPVALAEVCLHLRPRTSELVLSHLTSSLRREVVARMEDPHTWTPESLDRLTDHVMHQISSAQVKALPDDVIAAVFTDVLHERRMARYRQSMSQREKALW